jgi:pimeloyl-ACP methyl ester carboxylesterase
MKLNKSGFNFLLILFITVISKNSLFAQQVKIAKGHLIKSEQIALFDKEKLSKINNEELQEFLNGSPTPFEAYKGKLNVPKNSLTLYKLTYQTSIPEKNNKPTIATGLIAIPDQIKEGAPMVSYQHGTVFGKMDVPSHIESSMEMKLILSQFGGQGFVCISADYIGLGDSKELNSYFSRKANEEACMDMYSATMEFLQNKKVKTGPFFTIGWSQGGYNNMIFLRRLEEAKIPVTASATAAAPVDLNLFLTRGVVNPKPIDAVFTPAAFGNMLFSIENYYNIPGLTKSIIRPQYYALANDFYNFKIDFLTYLQKTTTKVVDYVQPAFIEQMKAGNSRLTKILNDAEAYRWLSTTPLRAYYGMKDEAVPSYLAKLAIDYQSLLGKTNGQSFNAGDNADHRNTYIQALIEVEPWFETFIK